MNENIDVYGELLKKFSNIRIEERESTFLELCRYPGERFEEICSRILEFFFQPNENHKFNDLWFKALCNILDVNCDEAFEMKTRTEEVTYATEENRKRIDIILETPKHIFAIENKIGASVYNPLDVYKKHVESNYKDLSKHLVLLTAHKIVSAEEHKKVKDNGFKIVLYEELFAEVKKLMGEYLLSSDNRYLAFMVDFMKTVDNKINVMANSELNKFFLENRKKIDRLNDQYNKWKNNILQIQRQTIAEWNLKEEMNSCNIGPEQWWIWQGWDLGISFNDNTPFRIGIESKFKETIDSEIGEFHIYITTWNLNCWKPYKDEVLKEFPIVYLDEGDSNPNRVYFHLPKIERKNFENDIDYKKEITSQLFKFYTFLKALAKEKIKE